MHASTVVVGNRGVLIKGRSGAGKSSLALRLIKNTCSSSRFSGLVSDDQTVLTAVNGQLIARCPNTIAGQIEIRGFGIFKHDFIPSAVVHLVVNTISADKMERMPLQEYCEIDGINLPQLSVPGHLGAQSVRMVFAMLAFINFDQ